MKTSIIMATTGSDKAQLEKTLVSLLPQCDKFENIQIIVVENGTPNKTFELVSFLKRSYKTIIKYLFSNQANKSIAINQALHELESDFIIFVDDDCFYPQNFINEYIQAARKYGEGFYYGGPTSCIYEAKKPSRLTKYGPASANGWKICADSRFAIISNTFFLGYNWAIFKQDLDDVGVFNPAFGPGSLSGGTGQETEMQIRLIIKGCKQIYLREAMVEHVVPRSHFNDNWILNRIYKNAISSTCFKLMGCPDDINNPPTVMKSILFSLINLLLFPSSKRLFKSKLHFSRLKGLIHGYKYFKNNPMNL